jgi:hypothetical protein
MPKPVERVERKENIMTRRMLTMAVTLGLMLSLLQSPTEARAQFYGSPYGYDTFSYLRHNITLHNVYETRRQRAAHLRKKQKKQRKETTTPSRKDHRSVPTAKHTGK